MVIFMVTHISHLYSGDFSSADVLEHCFHGEPKIIISTTPDTWTALVAVGFSNGVRVHWKIRAFDSWELIVGFKSSLMFFLLPSWEACCFPWDKSWLARLALCSWSQDTMLQGTSNLRILKVAMTVWRKAHIIVTADNPEQASELYDAWSEFLKKCDSEQPNKKTRKISKDVDFTKKHQQHIEIHNDS